MSRIGEAITGLRGQGGVDWRQEALKQGIMAQTFAEESLARADLALDEEGWRRLSLAADRDFTRGGLDDIIQLSRVMYLVHPLVQRGVNVTTYYTWAQGATFKGSEEKVHKELVEPMMEDDGNRAELYSHQSRILTQVDQMLDGNNFFALLTGPKGEVSPRSIPAEEIREIYTSPNDRQQVWYYRRRWTETIFNVAKGQREEKQREALYPDWRYHPNSKPNKSGNSEIIWDQPIIHRRTGGLKHMQFGVPSTYSVIDWARAYKKFLEDWHTIVASLARFAWNKTKNKGSKKKATKDKLQSTLNKSNPREGNDPPGPGAVHIDDEDSPLMPINKSGATTSAEDAKPSRLVIASGLDVPDTMLSQDPQQGALATAKTLDRPTELGFMNWQALERSREQDIFRYAFDAKVRRGERGWGRVIRENGLSVVEPSIDPTVDIAFPPILEHEPNDVVAALVSAATLDGKADAGTIPRETLAKALMEAVGVEDVEEALSEIDLEAAQELETAVETLRESLGRLGKDADK